MATTHLKIFISKIWLPAILLLAFLWMAAFGASAIQSFGLNMPGNVPELIPNTINVGVWLSAAFLINRIIDTLIWDFLVTRAANMPAPKLLRQLSALVIYCVAAIGAIGFVFEQSITALITTSSAVGLLVGFAVRSLILDAFAGIALHLEQPFRIGNFIKISGKGPEPIMGFVQEVNWRTTRLLTTENHIIVIPNGPLSESIIVNFSEPNPVSEFEQTIKLDFSVKPERALRVLESALHMTISDGSAMAKPAPSVRIVKVDETGVHYKIKYSINTTMMSPGKAKHLVLRDVLDSLHHAGVTPALPKQDMYVARMPNRALDYENLEHRATLLGRTDLFSELDRAALDLLVSQAEVRIVPAGKVVIEQDDDGHSMWVVAEGILGVRVRGADGNSLEVGRLRPGGFFGEMSVLTGEKRSATVYTITDAVLYEITKQHIATLLDTNPEIATILSRTIAERQLRNSAAANELPSEARAEQRQTLADQLMRSMATFFGRIFRAA